MRKILLKNNKNMMDSKYYKNLSKNLIKQEKIILEYKVIIYMT